MLVDKQSHSSKPNKNHNHSLEYVFDFTTLMFMTVYY